MPMIYVVRFPFCNFFGLERYLRVRNMNYRVLAAGIQLSLKDCVILPGVGTYEQAMTYLNDLGLSSLILEHADRGGRLLGICLGMQLLFNSSEESPGVKGLGLLSGDCIKIPSSSGFRVPHIGWNQLVDPISANPQSSFYKFSDLSGLSCADYYFVHSYVVRPSCLSVISSCFQHPAEALCASVAVENVSGVQFHPEKSGCDGYALLDLLLGE